MTSIRKGNVGSRTSVHIPNGHADISGPYGFVGEHFLSKAEFTLNSKDRSEAIHTMYM